MLEGGTVAIGQQQSGSGFGEFPCQLTADAAADTAPLRKLLETRNKLRDLMTKVDRSDELEGLLEQVLQNDEELKRMADELGLVFGDVIRVETAQGSVELSDIVEGEGYTISGEGKGGAAGFAKGCAKVRLSDAEPTEGTAGPATLLAYEAEAKVGGKLAQLGSRLIDGFAKKMADQFFQNFQEAVEGPADPGAAPEGEDGKKKGWFKRMVS